MQDIQSLLQEAEETLKEFYNSPHRSERVLNFLRGKIFAYRTAITVLERVENKREVKTK